MKTRAFLALLLPLLLTLGCPVRKFELVMKRQPDGKVQRELTVWTDDGGKISGPVEDVLAAAQAAYEAPGMEDKGKRRFSNLFSDRLPADLVHEGLANHGICGCKHSRMGDLFTYVERMPGQTNLVELFRRGEEIADTVVKAWIAWARKQPALADQPERLAGLETFLQTEFRDDLLTAMLMGWQTITRINALEDRGEDPDESTAEAIWRGEAFRLINYAAERGYLPSGADLLPTEGTAHAVYRGVLCKAAEAMGHPSSEPLPAPLDKLGDPDDLGPAFEQGLQEIGVSTEEFSELVDPAMPGILGSNTEGTVTWRGTSQPIYTNGNWDSEQGELSWQAVGRQGCASPQLLFAIWAEPDREFQRARLGSVALSGVSLHDYVCWREELPVDKQTAWDAFVGSLRPGPDLVKKLKHFRFHPTSLPASAPATQPADGPPRGARLILAGLANDDD